MQLIPESNELGDYLGSSDIIDFDDAEIRKTLQRLQSVSTNELDLAKNIYEYVRDAIPHSFDIGGMIVTCNASDVLRYGEGICFAKSHLLAALMRSSGIPTGFCYQLLVFDDSDPDYKTLHGLNAIYLKGLSKWIRLDARGNKAGVDAQFSTNKEKLAFPVRAKLGECDYPVIYVQPDGNVIKSLNESTKISELMHNLPSKLVYIS